MIYRCKRAKKITVLIGVLRRVWNLIYKLMPLYIFGIE